MSTTQELRFKSYNTRRNLPASIRRKRGEANFLGAFIRAMLEDAPWPCAYGRNFSVPGCGVADLVLCRRTEGIEPVEDASGLRVLAFEMKLTDWQKALQQAFRYKYYADFSIVVLPEKNATCAVRSSAIFETLGVGLWTFDTATGSVQERVTARQPEGPLNAAKRDYALSRLCPRLVNFRKSYE